MKFEINDKNDVISVLMVFIFNLDYTHGDKTWMTSIFSRQQNVIAPITMTKPRLAQNFNKKTVSIHLVRKKMCMPHIYISFQRAIRTRLTRTVRSWESYLGQDKVKYCITELSI
jgi:hypothetical protein